MRMSTETTPAGRSRGLRFSPMQWLPATAMRLSPMRLFVAAALLFVADWGYRRVGASVVPGGLLDETAHLVTTVLVLWALGPTMCQRFMVPAMVASVVIDLDH